MEMDFLQRIHRLYEHLSDPNQRDLPILLILDDAQTIDEQDLKDILLLSTPASGKATSLRFLLCGLPELQTKVNQLVLADSKQYSVNHHHLECLEASEITSYINQRVIAVAGAADELFTADAVSCISEVSGGIPRSINEICCLALEKASVANEKSIGAGIIDEIGKNLVACRHEVEAFDEILGEENAESSRKSLKIKFSFQYKPPRDVSNSDLQTGEFQYVANKKHFVPAGQEIRRSYRNETAAHKNVKETIFQMVSDAAWKYQPKRLALGVAFLVLLSVGLVVFDPKSPQRESTKEAASFQSEKLPAKPNARLGLSGDTVGGETKFAKNDTVGPLSGVKTSNDLAQGMYRANRKSEKPVLARQATTKVDKSSGVDRANRSSTEQPHRDSKNLSILPPEGAIDGSRARLFIDNFENNGETFDFDAFYEQAKTFSENSQFADAYILYFYAAKNGHGRGAFKLAQLVDPATFNANLSMIEKPSLILANNWYQRAGHPKTAYYLDRLYARIEKQAAVGDELAESLMLELE